MSEISIGESNVVFTKLWSSDVKAIARNRGERLTDKEARRALDLLGQFMDWKHALDLAIDEVLGQREEAS